jgi:hypothetical protein
MERLTEAEIRQARNALDVGYAGEWRLISQMQEERPLTGCRIWAWLATARWSGLRWPGTTSKALEATIRRATGVPEYGPDGGTQGTTAADLARALETLFPWIRTRSQLVTQTELFEGIRSGEWGVSIPVSYGKMPARQRRWSPSFTGGHMISLPKVRMTVGRREVVVLDPLGTGDYRGDWIAFEDLIRAAAGTYAGRVYVTIVEKGDTMQTLVKVERAFDLPAAVRIERGAPLFRVDTASGDFVAAGQAGQVGEGTTRMIIDVDRLPERSDRPSGRMVAMLTGDHAGMYVRRSATTITPVAIPELPQDLEQQLANARAEGKLEGIAEAEGVLKPLADYGASVLSIPEPTIGGTP